MGDERLPLLRGRISRVDTFEGKPSPVPLRLPKRDPVRHRDLLLAQLKAIKAQASGRAPGTRDPSATREVIAVRAEEAFTLKAESIGDKKTDVRVVGVSEDNGMVLLDAPSADLAALTAKIEAFGDDARVTSRTKDDGTVTTKRASEQAVAPIQTIRLATLQDRQADSASGEPLKLDVRYWFELGCSGGYRVVTSETTRSRIQVEGQMAKMGVPQRLQEFMAPERVYFCARLTPPQLAALLAATDCVYEWERAPAPLRDLHVLETVTTQELREVQIQPPPADAPSIVVLDTGIASGHPLLAPAILSATKGHDSIPSPEDSQGHGTKMAGIALYSDLGVAVENGAFAAPHWIQSSRVLVKPGAGMASDDHYASWPATTRDAVIAAEEADPGARKRVFAMAVTRSMQVGPLDGLAPTLWSHAVDQLAFGTGGATRLLIVSAGNARQEQWLPLAEQYPHLHRSEKIHQPAQAYNALTVGASTTRVSVPLLRDYAEAKVVASAPGGISPFTSTGVAGSAWPIKPDIVMEGGNLAISGTLPDASVPTLNALTTSYLHTKSSPFAQLSMTSEATARAAHLAARILAAEPALRPETVRALMVHAASWTPEMMRQFEGKEDRLHACGYGIPDEDFALACARDRATIVVEDVMPNLVHEEEPRRKPPKKSSTKPTERKERRKVKVFRLPVPLELPVEGDPEVELRVTLSYFAEPNKFGRASLRGLDLKWDMQGPQETEEGFLDRVNRSRWPKNEKGKRIKPPVNRSFPWAIRTQLRSRGTVQSDRWRGPLSSLGGDKLIAVIPVLGWWDQRVKLRGEQMPFSLVVSVIAPSIYGAIKPLLDASVPVPVEV